MLIPGPHAGPGELKSLRMGPRNPSLQNSLNDSGQPGLWTCALDHFWYSKRLPLITTPESVFNCLYNFRGMEEGEAWETKLKIEHLLKYNGFM